MGVLRRVPMSFLLILSKVRDLALATEMPDLLPAESLSALLSAGLRPEPGDAVMSAAQDLMRVPIVRKKMLANSDWRLENKSYRLSDRSSLGCMEPAKTDVCF